MKFTLEHALIVILVLAILLILLRNLFNRLKRDKLNLKIVKGKHKGKDQPVKSPNISKAIDDFLSIF